MEVRVGPPSITIHADEQFLVCAADGTIDAESEQGYFCVDTRLVSTYRLTLSGVPPTLLNSAVVAPFSARHEFVNARLVTPGGPVECNQVHVRLDRTIHHGLHEDYDLTNHSAEAVELDLELRIDGDYADLFDVKAHQIARRGTLETRWEGNDRNLTARYQNRDFQRGLRLEVRRHDSEPEYANGRLSFRLRLKPKEHWHTCLLWIPFGVGAQSDGPVEQCHALLHGDVGLAERRRVWRRRATRIHTGDEGVNAVLERAIDDLGALRMHRHDEAARGGDGQGIEEMALAAGIPWFVSLFGRDSLLVSLQTLLVTPGIARGSLQALAAVQGDRHDDRRDLQPGKIQHEIRHGELAHFGLIPQTPYYGTHDAPALFVWTTAELWRWTADRELMTRLRPNVERALEWIDRDGDRDDDGLQEYETRAGDWGYYNQSWKDSGEAIVNADGSNAELPIALASSRATSSPRNGPGPTSSSRPSTDTPAPRVRATTRTGSPMRSRGVSGGKTRAPTTSGSTAQATDRVSRLERRTPALGGRGIARAGRVGRQTTVRRGYVERLRATHALERPRVVQPVLLSGRSVWPHDNAIIANGCSRYGHDQVASRIARRCSTRPSASATAACLRCSAASRAMREASRSSTSRAERPRLGRQEPSSTS